MAIINPMSVMDIIKGKLGDFVLKNYNGKLVLSSRPDMRHVKPSEKQLHSRRRFALAVQYAKAILNDIDKKLCYEKLINPKETVYQFAIKEYYRLH